MESCITLPDTGSCLHIHLLALDDWGFGSETKDYANGNRTTSMSEHGHHFWEQKSFFLTFARRSEPGKAAAWDDSGGLGHFEGTWSRGAAPVRANYLFCISNLLRHSCMHVFRDDTSAYGNCLQRIIHPPIQHSSDRNPQEGVDSDSDADVRVS